MENHHFNGKIHYQWPFSIAILTSPEGTYFYWKKNVNSTAQWVELMIGCQGAKQTPWTQGKPHWRRSELMTPPFFHAKRWLEWQGETNLFSNFLCYPMMIGMAILFGRYSPTILQLSAIFFLRKLVNDEDSEWESPPHWG